MRVVLVGTGTHIGKTHLGVTLVTAAARRGWKVGGLKPVESGVPHHQPGEDAVALAAASTAPVHFPQPYALPDPVSPHLAARRAHTAIDLATIRRWVDAHTAPWLFIETAGALLSPLSPTLTNLDLALSLTPDAYLLVAPDRLGVLHDVTATLLALKPHVLAPPLVVLQSPSTPDTSTGTNAEELQLLHITPRAYTMPRGAPDSSACQGVADTLLDALLSHIM